MSAIVVFDGDCGLCNGFVAWLIRHDKFGRYLLAGSAGSVGAEVIRRAGLPADIGVSTIVLWQGPDADATEDAVAADGSRVLTKSDAVLTILGGLGLPWSVARLARAVPRGWRNRVYDFIAARRSRVAAEDPACGVPPADLLNLWRSRLATSADIS